jgi:hypothetical protein
MAGDGISVTISILQYGTTARKTRMPNLRRAGLYVPDRGAVRRRLLPGAARRVSLAESHLPALCGFGDYTENNYGHYCGGGNMVLYAGRIGFQERGRKSALFFLSLLENIGIGFQCVVLNVVKVTKKDD